MKLLYVLTFLFGLLSGTISGAREIQRVNLVDFGGDIERFYREYGDNPVIVEDVYQDDEFLGNLTLAQVEQAFKGRVLQGYNRKNDATGRIREEIPSELFFDDFRGGASHFYVFDHEVSDSPFAGKINIPPFLDNNWLDESYGFNLTLSGRGSFTPFHEDGSGEQAWMYVVTGEKHWNIYPPKCRPLLWDSLFKNFYNSRTSHAMSYPYLDCAEKSKITAVTGPGDLIFLPPGWIHEVLTTEDSFGIGGNIVNEFQAYQSIKTGLNEKAHALRHDFDMFKLYKEKVGQTQTEYGKDQLKKSFELIQEWLTVIRDKSDILLTRVAGTGPSGETGARID